MPTRDTLGVWFTRGIAPAQLQADNNAPRTADSLRQRLGHRMYAHRERAAGIFLRCWQPSPESSRPGRLIRRTYHAGCTRCCAYLPIALSDYFSLTSLCSQLAIPPYTLTLLAR